MGANSFDFGGGEWVPRKPNEPNEPNEPDFEPSRVPEPPSGPFNTLPLLTTIATFTTTTQDGEEKERLDGESVGVEMLRSTFAKLLPPGTPSVTVSLAPTTAWRYVRWGVGLGLGAVGLVLLNKYVKGGSGSGSGSTSGGGGGGASGGGGKPRVPWIGSVVNQLPQLVLGGLGLGRKRVAS